MRPSFKYKYDLYYVYWWLNIRFLKGHTETSGNSSGLRRQGQSTLIIVGVSQDTKDGPDPFPSIEIQISKIAAAVQTRSSKDFTEVPILTVLRKKGGMKNTKNWKGKKKGKCLLLFSYFTFFYAAMEDPAIHNSESHPRNKYCKLITWSSCFSTVLWKIKSFELLLWTCRWWLICKNKMLKF